MKALQNLIGNKISITMYHPGGIHNSREISGVLIEIHGHLIAVSINGTTHIYNTMSAPFENIYERK